MSKKRVTKNLKKSGISKNNNSRIIIILIIIFSIILIYTIYELTSPNSSLDNQWGSAPDFTLATLDGETFTLSEHLGKIILIDFTADNCYWCDEGGQMDELLTVYDEIGSETVMISIDPWYGYPYYETESQLENFRDKYGAEWIFAMDNSEEDVAGKYGVYGIPKIVIIDKNGNVYYSFSALTFKESIINKINEASNV
ncbi:MAG: TlpA family protein disulfide reductase [Thermoplasmatales archaeon]|nr:MAG: TlpA family protein disulfide reductase [Thermoplasmatales archaeon]